MLQNDFIGRTLNKAGLLSAFIAQIVHTRQGEGSAAAGNLKPLTVFVGAEILKGYRILEGFKGHVGGGFHGNGKVFIGIQGPGHRT